MTGQTQHPRFNGCIVDYKTSSQIIHCVVWLNSPIMRCQNVLEKMDGYLK